MDYCNNMDEEQKKKFYEQAIIPQDISLEIEHFGDFYEARKNMLKEKIIGLL